MVTEAVSEIRAKEELELLGGKNGNPATQEEDVAATAAEDDDTPF